MDTNSAERVLERALAWARENYAQASTQHQAAFANSVSYLVTGFSGGYGGPSLREHLVSWSLGEVGSVSVGGVAMTTVRPTKPLPGEWQFEDAVAFAAPLCFNPAEAFGEKLLQIWEREYSFDNDPEDVNYLRRKGES